MPIAPAAHDVGSSAMLRDMRIQAEEADEIDEAEMMRALRFVGERKTITPQKEKTSGSSRSRPPARCRACRRRSNGTSTRSGCPSRIGVMPWRTVPSNSECVVFLGWLATIRFALTAGGGCFGDSVRHPRSARLTC